MARPNTEPKPLSPEDETIERVLAANLMLTRTFAPIGEQAFTTLYLISDGRMVTELPHVLDDQNFRMLHDLYRELGLDLTEKEGSQSLRISTRMHPDSSGFMNRYDETGKIPISETDYFLEQYARDGDWQSFQVRLVHDARQSEQAA